MANQIEVTSLAAQAASSIDGDTQVVAFTQSGDTTRLPLVEAVAQANTSNGNESIKKVSLTIATADVLHLNTTPLTIVAAPGAGLAIEVLSASMKMVYNSVAYATNTALSLVTSTADLFQFQTQIAQTANCFSKFESEDAAPDGVQFVDNQALTVTVESGDPTAGDSDIKVYVTYRIITL